MLFYYYHRYLPLPTTCKADRFSSFSWLPRLSYYSLQRRTVVLQVLTSCQRLEPRRPVTSGLELGFFMACTPLRVIGFVSAAAAHTSGRLPGTASGGSFLRPSPHPGSRAGFRALRRLSIRTGAGGNTCPLPCLPPDCWAHRELRRARVSPSSRGRRFSALSLSMVALKRQLINLRLDGFYMVVLFSWSNGSPLCMPCRSLWFLPAASATSASGPVLSPYAMYLPPTRLPPRCRLQKPCGS